MCACVRFMHGGAHGQYGAVSNLQDTFGAALCSAQLDKNGVWPGNTPEISFFRCKKNYIK